jgi:hypothetical protein
MSDTAGEFDLDLATAALRADSGDVRILLKALSDQLSGALGDRLKLLRSGGRLRRSESIEGIEIALGNDVFSASLSGSSLACSIARLSGGIKIRSEQVGVDEWITRLVVALQEEAVHSQATRVALENIVIKGHP